MSDRKKSITKNLVWRLAERCGNQGVVFIVSVILARLLDPEVHGTIALVTVFITIMQVFIDSGLGNALIQKKDADHLDYSTVFYFNIVFCIVLYWFLYFAAPYIALFFKAPELTSLIRVLSLTLIISGVKNVQQAYVTRNLLFKRFFFSSLGGTFGAAVIGIVLAYCGYGVWSLVAQSLFNNLVGTVILWMTVKWRPKLEFSFERLKRLYSYGWKIFVSKLLDTIYNDLRQLVIGKMYTKEDLAFYNKGKQLSHFVVSNINTSIDSVLFPVMSQEQDDSIRIKAMTRRAIKTSTYIMAPLMLGLAVCAENVVKIIYTDKWLPCVPFMVVFCITYMFQPIHTANLNAIKAMGRSDLFLKLELVKKLIGMCLLIITAPMGVMAMAYSLLISNVLSQIINSWPNKKLLCYSYWEQLKDIFPAVVLAGFMSFIVIIVGKVDCNVVLKLLVQVGVGAFTYIGGSWLLGLESFKYICSVISNFKRKDKRERDVNHEN